MVKFLIIRFSSIGDIVLTSPVVRCLKQQVEGAEVHFLTKKQFASVVATNPYIDKVHVYDNNLTEVIKQLRLEEYDYIIDLHQNLRTAMVKLRLPGINFSFNKLNVQKWLLVHFKIDYMPQVHIVDRYLKTLQLFDVVNDGLGLNYFITPNDEVSVNELPESHRKGYLALVIGANHATKVLPQERLIELCQLLDFPVLLMGGPSEAALGQRIADTVGNQVFNACGKFSLNRSASLIKQARLVISHDTGLMHIAAAFKKNILSIWGNTVPEFGMYPYLPGNESRIFEVKDLPCRPCSKIGHKKCPKKHFNCMMQQSLEQLAAQANEMVRS